MRAPSPTRLALLVYGWVIRMGSNPHPNNNQPKSLLFVNE
jgi:hypothetical protein